MPQNGFIYRILLISPSDCNKEKKAIIKTIHKWNLLNSFPTSCILEPIVWEIQSRTDLDKKKRSSGHKQLTETHDILVGAFWTRLGTQNGEAEDRTIDIIESFRKSGKPVLLFFSSNPVIPSSIVTEQFNHLFAYYKKLEKKDQVIKFDSLSNLKIFLKRNLNNVLPALHEKYSNNPMEIITSEDYEIKSLLAFKAEFESFLDHNFSKWISSKKKKLPNVDHAKDILKEIVAELLVFRAHLIRDKGSELTSLIEISIQRINKLEKDLIDINNKKILKSFWKEGDKVFKILNSIPGELDNMMDALC